MKISVSARIGGRAQVQAWVQRVNAIDGQSQHLITLSLCRSCTHLMETAWFNAINSCTLRKGVLKGRENSRGDASMLDKDTWADAVRVRTK